jgi:hypothetical protein
LSQTTKSAEKFVKSASQPKKNNHAAVVEKQRGDAQNLTKK